MNYKKHLSISILTAALLSTSLLSASEDSNLTLNDSNTTDSDYLLGFWPASKDFAVVPFAFSSDSTGFAGGLAMIKQGLFQEHTTTVASIFYGAEQDTWRNGRPDTANFSGGFLAFSHYKIPYTERLFFSFVGMTSYFPKAKYYFDGSNDSNEDAYLETSGDTNWFDTNFEYVLPIGEGLNNPEKIYPLRHGFAVGRENYGGGTPFETGTTSIGIKTFYSKNEFENRLSLRTPDKVVPLKDWSTNGLKFYLKHDNTDYDLNPSRGYHFDLQYSRDFGWGDSLQDWDFLEFKYNQYFTLPTFSFTKQNVLALSVWTGASFSWDDDKQILPGIDKNSAPMWEGARLGGFNKMRGYENNRFSDKAVFYATAEYRAILNWNPFRDNDYIPVAVDWFQVVPFVEVGRVNDHYNFDLLTDLKFDAGISLRAMVAEMPVRFDVAVSDEGTNMWVMLQQPFDF